MIGAAALSHHVPMGRRTEDVDIVLSAHVVELHGLVQPLGFERYRDVPHRYRSRGQDPVFVDILPVDPEVLEEGYLEFEDGRRLNMIGFDLALDHTDVVSIDSSGTNVAVARLPVIALLKMVSYLDRPGERERDLEDLHAIFEHALGPQDDIRWEDKAIASIAFDHQGAYFVGRWLGRIAGPTHLSEIRRFQQTVLRPGAPWFSRWLAAARFVAADPERRLLDRCDAFLRGLDEARNGDPRS